MDKRKCFLPSRKGVKLSDETKKKMSDAKKGLPSNHKGHLHSDETKAKMSATRLAKYKSLREVIYTFSINYSIHAGDYLIEIFTEKKNQPGTVVVTNVEANDAILIEGFKTIRSFARAITAMEKIVQIDANSIVQVSKGNESWLSLFPKNIFNWHQSLLSGYTKDEQDDPLSLKNQNIFPVDQSWDWLQDEE